MDVHILRESVYEVDDDSIFGKMIECVFHIAVPAGTTAAQPPGGSAGDLSYSDALIHNAAINGDTLATILPDALIDIGEKSAIAAGTVIEVRESVRVAFTETNANKVAKVKATYTQRKGMLLSLKRDEVNFLGHAFNE